MPPRLAGVQSETLPYGVFLKWRSFDWAWASACAFALLLSVLALRSLAEGSFKEFIVIAQAIVCVLAPRIIGASLEIPLPRWIEVSIALHVGLTLVGGELAHLYEQIWWWDIPPHLLAGFLAAYVAMFAFVHTFGTPSSLSRRILLLSAAIVASIGFSGLWELYEFSADALFGTLMQPSPHDTMYDLAAGTIGALFSLVPYRSFTTRS